MTRRDGMEAERQSGDGIRAFIAIPLPDDARAQLAALGGAAPPGASVRWLAPAAMHLTLKFLGGIAPNRVERLTAALAEMAWESGPLRFTMAGVGGFPSLARPRVLWAGIREGAEAVCELAARVEAATAPLGFPAEDRRFAPHLTIGRLRTEPPRDWGDRFAHGARLEPIEVRAEAVVLYQSQLLPTGARHTPLATVSLAKK